MKKQVSYVIMIAVLIVSGFTGCVSASKIEKHKEPVTTTQPEIAQSQVEEVTEGTTSEANDITYIDISALEESYSSVVIERKTEDHPDIEDSYKGVENNIVTITGAGVFEFTGEAQNLQIRVDAGEEDEIDINLNNVSITNNTAPAIYIKNAKESGDAHEGAVTINLMENSNNIVTGSHYAEHFEGDVRIKNDGAVSSNVSFNIDGTGDLEINADNEGVETKMHLAINGGNIVVNSKDDALNANEDGISHITINDGSVYAKSIFGSEGDGMDSNGWLTINGGTVVSLANEASMDSGLDSDLGIAINGGTIAATGNMYDDISSESSQDFVHLIFSSKTEKGTLVVLTDEEDNPVIAFEPITAFSQITLSSSTLKEGSYKLYNGGTIDGAAVNGVYTEIVNYQPGTQQEYTGIGNARMGFGGGNPPPNFGEEGMQPPNMEEGKEPPNIEERPEGPPPNANKNIEAGEPSSIFEINKENRIFNGIISIA